MDLIRTGLNVSVGRWKALLIAFCLLSVTVMSIEGAATLAALARGTEGLLGVKRGDSVMHDGHRADVVLAFKPWSLAPQAGVRAGDLLQFERWYDQGLSYLPGEVIPVTLVRDGATLHAEITAAGRPIENLDRWHFLLNAALCGLGTLFGLVIGLRQAEVRTSRALALAFLWWSLNLGRSYADPVWPLVFVQLTYWIALVPGWYSGRRVGAAACAACCRCSWWPWCRWNWWQWGWPWAGCRRAYSIGSRHRTSVLRAR